MLDRVQRRAKTLNPGRSLRGVALSPFWLIGATLGAAASLIWTAGRWSTAAVMTGFKDSAPTVPALSAEWLGRLTLVGVSIGVFLWLT